MIPRCNCLLVLWFVAGMAGVALAQTSPQTDFSNLISGIDEKISETTDAAEGKALRPPKGPLPPSFWERYHVWVFAGSGVLLLTAGGLVWYVRRPLPEPVVPPDVQARRDLESAAIEPDLGNMLSDLSRILRRYITQVFDLPRQELTTREFVALVKTTQKIDPGLAGEFSSFLQQCDERKFSPSPPDQPADPVGVALELIDRTETWLSQQRTAAGNRTS